MAAVREARVNKEIETKRAAEVLGFFMASGREPSRHLSDAMAICVLWAKNGLC